MWSTGVENGLGTAPVQGIHEYSATQRYPLGQKFHYRDKCFKYCRSVDTLVVDRLAKTMAQQVSGWAAPPTATDAGTDQVKATIGANEGVYGSGLVGKDELIGGTVMIALLNAGAGETTYCFYIEANTAVAAGGGVTTLTIDQPLPFACSTDARLEITGNPYFAIADPSGGYGALLGDHTGSDGSYMGLPMSPMTTTYPYGWLQTKGPCWISCAGTVGTGGAWISRVFAAYTNGSLTILSTAATVLNTQYVGYVYTRGNNGTSYAAGQGSPLIYLDISD